MSSFAAKAVLAAHTPMCARMTTLKRHLQLRLRKGHRMMSMRTELQGEVDPEECDGWCYT